MSAGQGGVSIGGAYGLTFLDGIISGAPKSGFSSRASWENVFRLGTSTLFGSEFIAVSPGLLQAYVSPTPSVTPAPVIAAAPTGFSSVKLGVGTLTFGKTVTYSGSITVTQPEMDDISGGVISVGQPTPETTPTVSANIPAPNVVADNSPVADGVAAAPPPPPNRRPKPPTPPGVPVVSR